MSISGVGVSDADSLDKLSSTFLWSRLVSVERGIDRDIVAVQDFSHASEGNEAVAQEAEPGRDRSRSTSEIAVRSKNGGPCKVRGALRRWHTGLPR